MHDPMTQVCQIKYPWPAYRGTGIFSRYHEPIITIWHVDPETDGTDDSCGWFMRSRHGDKATLEAIRKEFEFNWDPEYGGWFHKDGRPAMSTIGIITDMVGSAAWLHFKKDHRKRNRFMRANIWEIIRLAENTTDSMHESVTGKYGFDKRDHRIEHMASVIYGWVLRKTQRWYRHPRWHFWHYHFQIHPWQKFRRWLLTRCEGCGKRFSYGYCPVSHSWDSEKPKFLKGERGLFHSECSGAHMTLVKTPPMGNA